jgi:hypothetical protein
MEPGQRTSAQAGLFHFPHNPKHKPTPKHQHIKPMNNTDNTNTDLLKVLTREGVLIDVSVRFWRANKKLKAQDLGLDPDKVSDRLISLGHKRLLPRDATAGLALVESRTHAFVEANTFPFLGGIAKFLPNGKLAEVRERLGALGRDFERAKSEFLYNYAGEREKALTEWQETAHQLAADPAALMAAIEGSFPTPDKLEAKFAYETHLFQIALPQNLSKEMVNAGEQQEVISARRAAARQAKHQIQHDAEAFVTDCVTSLRAQTAGLCEEMLASMRGGKTGGVHQKTLNRLLRFIDQFKAMNFADDREMAETLEHTRREFLSRSAAGYRDDPGAQRDLEAGITAVRDHARDLVGQDAKELVDRFGQMGRRKLMMAG